MDQLTIGGGALVPLDAHLLQLLGQLFFELIQFRPPRGQLLQHLRLRHSGRS